MRYPARALLATILLAACEPMVPPLTPSPAPPAEDACGASGFASLIGQDASVLLTTTFATPTRIIHPGEAVALDFSPERLNFDIDAGERVARVFCG